MTTNLDAALIYASWGWHVLPVVANGKAPASQHGVKDATTDKEQITRWWTQNPDFNIGIAAGGRSGVIVFDIDPRNGGDDSWAEFQRQNGNAPDGVMQMTAGGGAHHVAMYDPAIRSRKLAAGIDLLSDGRYFVAFPSVINDKKYEWEGLSDPFDGVAPFSMPESWRTACISSRQNNTVKSVELIRGSRNDGLAALGGAMRHRGMIEAEIMAALTVANEIRCEPPLPTSEVAQIARSVSRYEPETDVALNASLGSSAAKSLLANADAKASGQAIIDKLQLVFADQISNEFDPPNELIEGLMTMGGLTIIYGDSNSGKTFLALSLAAAVATGAPCYGRKVDSGLVVYLASESPASVRLRTQAMKKFYNSDLQNLAIVPVPLNFYKGNQDATDVINVVKAVEALKDKSVQLVICDTMANMSAGANENSGEDMAPVMARFDQVARATGAAVMIIHHTGKDSAKGARGWSGIRAHIDTEIEVVEKDDVRSASITKQRELPSKGDTIYFKLEVLDMGVTKFGATATTCVAVPDDDSNSSQPHKKQSKQDADAATLKRAWFASGAEERDGNPYISRSALREFFVNNENKAERTAQNKTDSTRKDSLVFKLLKAGLIEDFEHGWVVVELLLKSDMLFLKKER